MMTNPEGTDMKAMANVEALIPSYKSGAETEFAGIGIALLGAHFWTEVMLLLYEPCRWAIPGGHYTPDFMAVLQDGRVVFVEIKGSKKQRNYRDARSKLRAAQAVYPMFIWVEVVQEDGWALEVLT